MLCEKSACTGCAACAAACLQNCIRMVPDFEGFLHPTIDLSFCNECKRCIRTCPVLHNNLTDKENNSDSEAFFGDTTADHVSEKVSYPVVFASWHLNDEIRKISSSGGVFTALAGHILSKGGIVVGAAFDEAFAVHHILIEKSSELYRLRGSKYVQSEVNPSFLRQIRYLLEHGRQILFSGTPCEVEGLRKYLNKSYENLYCCDLICHGVPSPLLFKSYIKEKELNGSRLVEVCFRDKSKGWKQFEVLHRLQNGKCEAISVFTDPYMRAFLRDYALRNSCYECRYKNTFRVGDITIADFWGVSKQYPQYDLEDKGTSLVLVNNEKGKALLNESSSELFIGIADLDTAISGNPCLVKQCYRPPQRESFYKDLKMMPYSKLLKKYKLIDSKYQSVYAFIKKHVKILGYIYKIYN